MKLNEQIYKNQGVLKILKIIFSESRKKQHLEMQHETNQKKNEKKSRFFSGPPDRTEHVTFFLGGGSGTPDEIEKPI